MLSAVQMRLQLGNITIMEPDDRRFFFSKFESLEICTVILLSQDMAATCIYSEINANKTL